MRRDRGRDFRGCDSQVRAPNDVRTNGAERRLVLEGTSGMTGMQG